MMLNKYKNEIFRQNPRQAGFSLIELIVGIFIIALLTGLSFANYHSTNNRSKLTLAAQAVLSDFKLAENNTLGMQVFGAGVPAGGWGLRFDISFPDRYIVFADQNENRTYNSGESFKTVILPKNITITNISKASPVDVVFSPPDPMTFIKGINNDNVDITLSDGETTKKININFLGLADITQ